MEDKVEELKMDIDESHLGLGDPPNQLEHGGAASDSLTEADESVDDLNSAIMRIPTEVWVLILSQLNQKDIIQARTIWKKWKEVIDAHFEFTVIVYEGKTDLDRVYELRIKDCLITRLISNRDIFQFPSLLRRVRFWGPVNSSCFQRIMDTCTSIEELSLTKFALMQPNLVGERRLNGFSKIKKLELLGYMCKDESKVIAENALKIFSYSMPDLEKLTINFNCSIPVVQTLATTLMEFISRHPRLQNVQLSLIPESSHPNEAEAMRMSRIVIPPAVEQLLSSSLKLKMLRITTATKDLPIWDAILNSQSSLQDFRMLLNEGGLLTSQANYIIGIPSQLVKAPLLRNASTLTSVELRELRLSTVNNEHQGNPIPFDAEVFRFAHNLKRLLLYRNIDDYRRPFHSNFAPNIINLNKLPTSINILEISRFFCRSCELQFACDVMENLKSIILFNTGSMNQLGVHGGIVESIANKSSILSMDLSPINYHCALENAKFEKVQAKFGFHEGERIYFDFDRFRKGIHQPSAPSAGVSFRAQRSVSIVNAPVRVRETAYDAWDRRRMRQAQYRRATINAFAISSRNPFEMPGPSSSSASLRSLQNESLPARPSDIFNSIRFPGENSGRSVLKKVKSHESLSPRTIQLVLTKQSLQTPNLEEEESKEKLSRLLEALDLEVFKKDKQSEKFLMDGLCGHDGYLGLGRFSTRSKLDQQNRRWSWSEPKE